MSLALGTVPPLPIPVLIAESEPLLLDRLPCALNDRIPGIALSLCSSRKDAMHALTLSRYQLVVSDVALAEAENFSLLRRHRVYQPFSPFIVTAQREDRLLATRAVEYGVDDIIVSPIDQVEAENSVRRAMWLYQMRVMMSQRIQTLDKLRNWRAIANVTETVGALVDERVLGMQETVDAYQRTIQQIETSLKYLTGVATHFETQAKTRIAENLNSLWRFRD